MKLEQVLAEVNYEVLQGSLDKEVADIAYDSRKVKKDVMFVAIEGTVEMDTNLSTVRLRREQVLSLWKNVWKWQTKMSRSFW